MNIGTRVRVTDKYPTNREHSSVWIGDESMRGRVGTVVNEYVGFTSVHLDDEPTNSFTYFYPGEIEELR